jgi:hypothetical protein
VAAHDLVDEPGFAFAGLPHVHVEAGFGGVADDLDLGVLVALADDAAFALFDVGGPPGAVDVVQGDGAGVDVGADAHLLGGPNEHGELAVAAAGEEPGPGFVVAGVVNERDVSRGDAVGDETPA